MQDSQNLAFHSMLFLQIFHSFQLQIQLENWKTSFKNVASIFDYMCSIISIQLSTITGLFFLQFF